MSVPFNITLESILESRHEHLLYHDFIFYLRQTYCLENLLFYQDVQDYRRKPNADCYQYIITQYILVDAAQEINIPCDMRQELILNRDYGKSTFDEAAESILELIRVNSFLPWWHQRNVNRRNTLSPSNSVPEHRWPSSNFFTNRPSFNSLRDVDVSSKQKRSLGNLFQQKTLAMMVRVKKSFVK
ncbi:RGS domain-containing protein [Mucor mucedo]|uniref:RGS domain-containing protein n=1 Tax=Mucor mucedo TaxID=29922 RepID=UPI00221F7A21|nr:RGS domain-containing protein [Mucor mucedo]KAI7892372.1 RGS domain-containing protein [Mucor mucedo]